MRNYRQDAKNAAKPKKTAPVLLKTALPSERGGRETEFCNKIYDKKYEKM
jgi:hypothetical protein